MGTVFNAKKWKGACVKGKKVCGLVKNGALFFKSDNYIPPISEIYKRRIMVGDNLKGKKVYADFPNDYILELQDRLGTSFKTNTLVNATNGLITEYTFPSMSGSGIGYYVSCNFASDSSDNRFYWCSSSNTDNYVNNSEVLLENDKDYNVTQIDDTNPSYRHLFVEDSNIRPLEVGDVITENTKFYFTFPDNFNSSINFEDRKYIVVMDNTYTGFIVNKDYLGSSVVAATISFGFGSTQVEIYEYDNDNDTLLQNDSYRTNIKNGDDNFVGTVTNIDTTDNIYQYILVDTTTLGA